MIRIFTAWLALATLLSACAPGVGGGAAHVSPIRGDAEIAAVVELLRAEDRRELDLPRVEAIAASDNPELRRRSALAAGRIRDRRALPLLLRLLGNPDSAVAATAAFALGHLGDTAAVPSLTPLLDLERATSSPSVAGAAALALGKARTAEGRRALLTLLAHASVVEPPSEAVAGALLAVWKFPRDSGSDTSPIVRWTSAPDAELRWRAVYALTRRPDPAAVSALARATEDSDWRVRSLALRGLAAPLADSSGFGAVAARGVLLHALEDADFRVRVNAARALGTHPHPESARALTAHLSGGDPHLAIAAAEALGRLGTAASTAAPTLRALALD
ncbi:MAG: HEAT repeat domain-containing protein, partial [Gemmatimonadota bacterium]|nr:HEAT repeat domain-containing protein [Gemmatimonadota bacterium]